MKKVLILEDDKSLADAVAIALQKVNMQTVISSTVDDALANIKKESFNLIIVDIMLSDQKNGFDFYEKLLEKKLEPKIPVIFLTNLDSEEKTALSMGADAFFIKSNISLDELVHKIENILR